MTKTLSSVTVHGSSTTAFLVVALRWCQFTSVSSVSLCHTHQDMIKNELVFEFDKTK